MNTTPDIKLENALEVINFANIFFRKKFKIYTLYFTNFLIYYIIISCMYYVGFLFLK